MLVRQFGSPATPTATPSATRTPTASATPTVVLTNGGFETGNFAGWSQGGVLSHGVMESAARSGSYGAQLGSPVYPCAGGVPSNESAWMYQTTAVPDTEGTQVAFWYRVFSQDNAKFDYLRVAVRDPAGHELASLWLRGAPEPGGRCEQTWDSGWQSATLGLAAYRGQQVQIYFENAVTDPGSIKGWYNTWSWVDDVRVTP